VKSFAELTEREILAVAIFAEEEDSRIYRSWYNVLWGGVVAGQTAFAGCHV
jgi:rubrerythrin